jgi:hypothetical protein
MVDDMIKLMRFLVLKSATKIRLFVHVFFPRLQLSLVFALEQRFLADEVEANLIAQ